MQRNWCPLVTIPILNKACLPCSLGRCYDCAEIGFLVAGHGANYKCGCTRPNHSGEPARKQVKDPFTGAVHAPGMEIAEDGTISRRDGDGNASTESS